VFAANPDDGDPGRPWGLAIAILHALRNRIVRAHRCGLIDLPGCGSTGVVLRTIIPFLLVTGCDRTPPEITRLADARLEQVRAFTKQTQASCVNAGPDYKVSDWGGLDEDPEVLNVRVVCKIVPGLGLAATAPTLRPEPEGNKSGTPYRVGVSKDKDMEDDPFPLEQITKPSWLTTEPNAADLCIASGHPDDADFTEVCVAFKLAAS
jgi:hypothetical protein